MHEGAVSAKLGLGGIPAIAGAPTWPVPSKSRATNRAACTSAT